MHPLVLSTILSVGSSGLVVLSSAAIAQSSVSGAGPRSDVGSGTAEPIGSADRNLAPDARHTNIAAALPSPDLPENAKPSDFLRAAEGALAAGHSGAAQEALEMAQTRMLDRSVPLGQTDNPSDNPTVGQISQALQALASRDRATCIRLIEQAIGSATAQGF